jgi:RNA polymerase sigma-70 factor (ECF subfamily)
MTRTGTDPGLRPIPPPAPQEPARGPDGERSAVETALVDRARAGEVAAWSRLYQETFDTTFRHVCFLLGDPVVAEDLVQDAYARAFTAIDRFDGRCSFAGWVKGIALNVVRMHWRRAETTERVHESLARLGEVAAAQPGDPDRAHQQDLRMRVLYQVLATLPEHLREVFILRELEGTSTREVAEQLGITPNNVAVRAARARAKIREELTRLGWLGGGA